MNCVERDFCCCLFSFKTTRFNKKKSETVVLFRFFLLFVLYELRDIKVSKRQSHFEHIQFVSICLGFCIVVLMLKLIRFIHIMTLLITMVCIIRVIRVQKFIELFCCDQFNSAQLDWSICVCAWLSYQSYRLVEHRLFLPVFLFFSFLSSNIVGIKAFFCRNCLFSLQWFWNQNKTKYKKYAMNQQKQEIWSRTKMKKGNIAIGCIFDLNNTQNTNIIQAMDEWNLLNL